MKVTMAPAGHPLHLPLNISREGNLGWYKKS